MRVSSQSSLVQAIFLLLCFQGAFPTKVQCSLLSLIDLSDILHLDVDGCAGNSGLEVNG